MSSPAHESRRGRVLAATVLPAGAVKVRGDQRWFRAAAARGTGAALETERISTAALEAERISTAALEAERGTGPVAPLPPTI